MDWSFHPYAIPLSRPYSWAKGVQTERRGLLVACTTEGVTGWGEVAPPPHLGVEPRAIATYARKSMRVALVQGDVPAALDAAGCGPRLRCGLAGAWLDAQARLAGKSLAEWLATRFDLGRRPARRVPVNALVTAQDAEACVRDATAAVKAGFATLKLKSDGNADRDVERVAAVRAAVPQAALRLDANESWSASTALETLRRLQPFGLEYVEQPVPAAHRETLVRLLRESPVAIALDESVTSWQAVAPFAAFDPVLVLKPQRLGGIDGTVALLQKAHVAGLRCVVTNSLETAIGRAHGLHAAALLPEPLPACGLATEAFLARDFDDGTIASRAGFMDVLAGPGLGFRPNVEATHAAFLE